MNAISKYLIIIISYALLGKISGHLAIPPSVTSPIWPAAGIALGAICIWGFRYLPAVLLGAIGSNLLLNEMHGFPLFTSQSLMLNLSIACGATLQAGIGAYFIRKLVKMPNALEQEQKIILFFIIGIVACLINATLSPLALISFGAITSEEFLTNAFTWWIGDCIGVILFAPLFIVIAQKNSARIRKISLLIPIILFAALAAITVKSTQEAQINSQHATLERHANDLIGKLNREIDTHLNILTAIEGFYSASTYVDYDEFKTFAKLFTDKIGGIQALSWNPRIKHENRAAFEQKMHDEGLKDFTIKDRFGIGKIESAPKRDIYFPVTYTYPFETNQAAIGYDTYGPDEVTNNARVHTLDEARDSGEVKCTGRISIVQAENQYGLIFYHPIFKNGRSEDIVQNRENLMGYTAGVFIIPELLQDIQKMAEELNVDFTLKNLSSPIPNNTEGQLLYDSRTNDFKEPASPIETANGALSFTKTINVAGQTWEFTIYQNDVWIDQSNRSLWYMLLGVFLFSLIITTSLLIVSAQFKKEENDTALTSNKNNHRAYIIPALCALITVSITLGVYAEIKYKKERSLHELIVKDVNQISNAISSNSRSSIIALRRMGQRWETHKVEIKEWRNDARNYVSDFFALTTVEWIDKNFTIQWVEPEAGNEKAIGLNIAFNEERERALKGASEKDTITLTPPLDLVQGYRAFITYIPLYKDNKFDGFIAGIYDSNLFVEKIISDLPFFDTDEVYIEVSDGNKTVFKTEGEFPEAYSSWMETTHIKMFNRDWLIKVWPQPKFFETRNSYIEEIIMIGGVLTSLLLSLAIFYAIISRKNAALLNKKATELSINEKQLTAITKRMQLILDNAGDGIYGLDLNGRTVFANKATKDMLGYNLGELIDSPHHEFISNTLKLKEINTKAQLKKHDGNALHVEYTSTPIYDDEGKATGAVVVFRDITERLAIEEEKKKYTDELEAAKEEALRANIMKSEFLANMSHEIRTPLNGIIGATDLLKKAKKTTDKNKYLDIITASGDTLLALINDILDLSKIEANELTLNPEPIDIRTFIDQSLHAISVKAKEKKIGLKKDFIGNVPSIILADPLRLNQIMFNLLGNAIKFVDRGFVAVWVEEIKTKGNIATLRITVEDTGIGIAEDKLESIFDKFAQADNSTTKKYGGTGLGLAITLRLIQMMDGQIGVESEEGKGTRFWLEIPFPFVEDGEKSNYDRTDDLKILVVNSTNTRSSFMLKYLDKLKIKYDTAKNDKDAKALITKANKSKKPYDAAIIDSETINDNGEKISSAINKKASKKHTPLFLFASENDIDKLKKKKAPFDDYISNSIDQSELREKLLNLNTSAPKEEPQEETGMTLNAHILLVENELINQMVATDMLENMNCTVELAENGVEALDKLVGEQKTYDAILMDGMMPIMDGFEATVEIRKAEAEGKMKHHIIIAMTANAMSGEKDKCIEIGMDDYLAKPVKEEILFKTLKKWIG